MINKDGATFYLNDNTWCQRDAIRIMSEEHQAPIVALAE